MASRLISKTAALTTGAGTLDFDQTDGERQRPDPAFAHNFVVITTLDASGDPVVPTAGTYTVYVETAPDGGFESLSDGAINATDTGGRTGAVGSVASASFDGNPWSIRIVADSVDAGTQFRAHVVQNLR